MKKLVLLFAFVVSGINLLAHEGITTQESLDVPIEIPILIRLS